MAGVRIRALTTPRLIKLTSTRCRSARQLNIGRRSTYQGGDSVQTTGATSKTRFVDFRNNRPNGTDHPETNGTSFTFLGFTHIWGKSRAGKKVVRQVTAKNRYARALAAVTDWCRRNRHQPIPDQSAHLTAMMRGHYAYYGISGNFRRISWYAYQVVRIWQKWLSRRGRGSRLLWSQFTALRKRHPLPAARIVHRYTFASETLP